MSWSLSSDGNILSRSGSNPTTSTPNVRMLLSGSKKIMLHLVLITDQQNEKSGSEKALCNRCSPANNAFSTDEHHWNQFHVWQGRRWGQAARKAMISL